MIAGAGGERDDDLRRGSPPSRRLERRADFEIDEDAHNVFLTDRGALAVEASLGCGSMSLPKLEPGAASRNALHAEALLRRDVDYIVRGGAVELVDELTGRVAGNRQWPDGLQAAIEAKGDCRSEPKGGSSARSRSSTSSRKYPRLCGMTATAHAGRGATGNLRPRGGDRPVAPACSASTSRT